MRRLLVLAALAIVAPSAQAGEFVPRQPAKVEPAKAPVVTKSRAKPVSRRTWQAKAQPKKPKKKRVSFEKRPMP